MELKDLQPQLDEIKQKALGASEEVKKELGAKIEGVEKKLGEIEKGLPNPAETKKAMDDLTKTIDEIKKSMSELFTEEDRKMLNDTATKVKSIKDYTDDLPGKQTTLKDALAEAFAVDENAKNIKALAENTRDHEKRFSMDLKAVGDMTITANYTGGTRGLQVMAPGMVAGPVRRVHIRDIVPGGTIGQGTEFVFMKENGTGEGAPSPVAEGWTKAQVDMDLIEASVKIETIAGWLRVTRKAMNNIPGFISWLQMRLPQRLLNIEDSQLLQGNGTSPNIKGIMTAGNYTAATTSSQLLVEQLIDGLAQLEDTNERYADGILLRPREYYRFFKTKTGGSKEYDLPKNVVIANGTLFISGVPVYQSTAVPAGKYIIGDFSEGCQLLVQEGMRLEFFEQDGTNVRENKITVRIEETVAFPVYGSDFFIVGDVGVNSITT